jgi:hypothetical protein
VEAADRSSGTANDAVCAECERASASGLLSLSGATLCAQCVEAYYVACSGCSGLLPADESMRRGGMAYCPECFARPDAPGGADPQSLITEYVALHAEEKRIGKRMSEIKESLKALAASQERTGNGVTLRAGEMAVRCSYRVSLKCDAEAVEALEQVLDKEEFARMFERKTSFNAVEDVVREFLSADDEAHRQARELLRKAVRETETATLNVVADRK